MVVKGSRRTQTDVRFRMFLLNLLDGRELTCTDLYNAMRRDYPEKDISYKRLHFIVRRLWTFKALSRRKEITDRLHVYYTLTKQGRKRIEYYKTMLEDLEG